MNTRLGILGLACGALAVTGYFLAAEDSTPVHASTPAGSEMLELDGDLGQGRVGEPDPSQRGAPVALPADAAPEAPVALEPTPEEVTEEEFKWRRETTPREVLEQERRDLEAKVVELVGADAFKRIADGEYEVVPTDEQGGIRLDRDRQHLIDFYTNNAEGETIRTTMPKAKFGAAYDLRQQQLWLTDMIDERKAIAGGH